MTIGQAIKTVRRATGMKQTELAEYLGVSVSSVRKWEQNRVRPTAQTVEELCQLVRTTEKLMASITSESIVKTIAESYIDVTPG